MAGYSHCRHCSDTTLHALGMYLQDSGFRHHLAGARTSGMTCATLNSEQRAANIFDIFQKVSYNCWSDSCTPLRNRVLDVNRIVCHPCVGMMMLGAVCLLMSG